jgi:hypothetical protein
MPAFLKQKAYQILDSWKAKYWHKVSKIVVIDGYVVVYLRQKNQTSY